MAHDGGAWRVADAKARLSELLRRASQEGPQRIGRRRQYVVVPAEQWEAPRGGRPPLGQWLLRNLPRDAGLEPPDRRDPPRPVSFDAPTR